MKPKFFIFLFFLILLRLYVVVDYGLNTEANFVGTESIIERGVFMYNS